MRHSSLNHTYRLVWSAIHSSFVAVAENVRGRGKASSTVSPAPLSHEAAFWRNGSIFVKFNIVTLAVSLVFSGTSAAADLPTGGQIVGGSGTIAQSGNVLTVTQSTNKLAADWQSFNIGSNSAVNFVQPSASAVALNRVLGSDVSVIQGKLNANGQIFLINPNGVLFTPSAQVNVGGLVASTLNISTQDFMDGKYNFAGTSSNAIINQGNITAINGGTIALIAAKITNTGTIAANAGNVLLGAGSKVTLDLGGPVKLQVTQGALDALILNGGAIKADGGLVYLTAKAAGDLAATVINNTGLIEAQTLATGEKGEIYLMGDMVNGTVEVGGTLNASAPNGGNGGFIETSAANVKISDNANITTSASTGAVGTWLIDPVDFYIAASGGNITGTALTNLLNSNSVKIQTLAGTNTSTNLYSSTSGNGDIFVNDSVGWSKNTLTLSADRNININNVLNGSGTAKLALEYGQAANNGVINSATATYNVNAPVNLSAGANLSTKLGKTGTTLNYTVITDSTALQNINLSNTTRNGRYALGSNINNASSNFTPIGNNNSKFTGILDGLGHSVSNLNINTPTTDYVGLFGYSSGAIRNVGISTGSLSGRNYVGALVGYNTGTISNSYTSATVTGSNQVGGLIGTNAGTGNISNSYSNGVVTGVKYIGGLVGTNNGTINKSYSNGAVSGTTNVGGFVGNNAKTISNSYWDIGTSGRATGSGGTTLTNSNESGITGLSTTNSKQAGSYTGWDFNNNWYMIDGKSYPLLRAFLTPLTVTAKNMVKTYDGAAFASNSTDVIYSIAGASLNTLSFGGNAQSATNAGSYQITASYTPSQQGYAASFVNGQLSINQRPITLTADSQAKLYGNTDPTLSYTVEANGTNRGLVGTDTFTGALSRTAGENVGSYTINANALANGNYLITAVNGQLSINQRPITLTADSQAKLYGNTDPTLSYTVEANGTNRGLVGTDTFTGALSRTAGENVGSYTINANALANGNYLITAVNGQLSINQRPITLTADSQAKLYGNTDPTLSYTVEANGTNRGLVGTDTFTGALSRTAGENVGSYTINANALANGNYLITAVNGQLSINQRPITLTADSQAKLYGNTDPTLSYTVEANGTNRGLVGTDTFTGALSRTAGENVGSYTINANALANGNYLITAVNGQLSINQRPITLTADSQAKLYGNTDPTLSYTVEANGTNRGLVGTDTFTGALSRTAGENVGSYTINANALANGNYLITAVNGQLSINQRPITLTADSQAKLYGNTDPTLSYTVEANGTNRGLVGTDTFTGALSRTAGENVGSYTINANALANGNYLITAVNGQLSINQRPITLTADSQAKLYGNTDPTLSYTVEANGTNRGLVGTDTFTGALSRTAGENVGSYTINANALANGNYLITAVNGQLSINQRPITLTAVDKFKLFGATDPALTFTIEPLAKDRGLVNGDTFSGVLTRAPGEIFGNYVIDASKLINGNYVINAVNGVFAIEGQSQAQLNNTSSAQATSTSSNSVHQVGFSAKPSGISGFQLVSLDDFPTAAGNNVDDNLPSDVQDKKTAKVFYIGKGINVAE